MVADAQSAAEKEELLAAVALLSAERDQLQTDLQENVEMVRMLQQTRQKIIKCVVFAVTSCEEFFFFCFTTQMIENQGELRTALEKNRIQMELIRQLENSQISKEEGPSETSAQPEERQANVRVQYLFNQKITGQ